MLKPVYLPIKLITCIATTMVIYACSPIDQIARDYESLKPSTMLDAPSPDPSKNTAYDPEQVARGRYLVELLGCGTCHTDGALAGEPDLSKRLAGSHIGIAHSDPLTQKRPGVVYPSNLTPDTATGLGAWNDEQIIRMIRTGVDKHGQRQLSVMPWPAYTKLSDTDAMAIVSYLRSLAPVPHQVPRNVPAGKNATHPYVYFGVYRSRK